MSKLGIKGNLGKFTCEIVCIPVILPVLYVAYFRICQPRVDVNIDLKRSRFSSANLAIRIYSHTIMTETYREDRRMTQALDSCTKCAKLTVS